VPRRKMLLDSMQGIMNVLPHCGRAITTFIVFKSLRQAGRGSGVDKGGAAIPRRP
jgi:hypothetical protein